MTSVLVTSLKPSDDGKALIVRLFNAGDQGHHRADVARSNTPKRIDAEQPARRNGQLLRRSVPLAAAGYRYAARRFPVAHLTDGQLSNGK